MPIHRMMMKYPAHVLTEIHVGDREIVGRFPDGHIQVIARLIEPEATPPKRKHRKKTFVEQVREAMTVEHSHATPQD